MSAASRLNPRTQSWLDAIEERIGKGAPLVLFHGTTEQFASFDLKKSRKELVEDFYGEGIFFTTSKAAAWQYAYAARNQGLSPEVIAALGRKNRGAARVLAAFVEHGRDVWEQPGVTVASLEEASGGVEANTLMDLAQHVRGSRYVDPVDEREEIMRALLGGGYGVPDWVFKKLRGLGVDPKPFMPKVYTVEVRVDRPLWTASTDKARRARKLGYDSIVYYGPNLVEGAPEVAVFDPRRVKILKVEFDEP